MPAEGRALLEGVRAAASRLETHARRERQWAAQAARDREVLGVRTVTSDTDVADLAAFLSAAAAHRGRLHVVVLSDRATDPGPQTGAQTKDTP